MKALSSNMLDVAKWPRWNRWEKGEGLVLKGKIKQIATKRYSMQDGWRNIKEGKAETLASLTPRRLLNSRLISFTVVLIPYSTPPFSWLRPHQSSSDHSSRQPDHFSFPVEHQKSCESWRFIHHYLDTLTFPTARDVNIPRCETKLIVDREFPSSRKNGNWKLKQRRKCLI